MGASDLSPTGDLIQVDWDVATCGATDYYLLYGDLAGVSSYALGGAVCSMGPGGSFTWSGSPSDFSDRHSGFS